eukprot:4657463-Amphidinium_carterae.1
MSTYETLYQASTSACALTFGWHCIHTSSTTQVALSISSGEAEHYAAVKSGSRLLGLIALMSDLGFTVRRVRGQKAPPCT